MWMRAAFRPANAVMRLFLFIITALLLFIPAYAHAALIPFGGLITKTIPCAYPAGAMYMVITPAGSSPPMQIWTPATVTFREGPPLRVGQWVLGLDAAAGLCIVSFKPFIAFPGMIMQMVGTSK